MTEQSIIGARASVMVYDDNQKKWVPSGSSSGLSKVQTSPPQQNNTFRVVGRKLHDLEVVINCSILKGLKYNQATATFHQWRDSKFVYGLNFSSQNDAENFARAMMHALEVLSGRVANNPGGQPTNGNGYEEDMGYRTMTSEDAAILRQNNGIAGHITPSAQTPTSQTNQNNIPQSPPTPQGHHRTSRNSLSAPPAPQPQQQQQQQMAPPGPHYRPPAGNGPTPNGLPPQVNPQIPRPRARPCSSHSSPNNSRSSRTSSSSSSSNPSTPPSSSSSRWSRRAIRVPLSTSSRTTCSPILIPISICINTRHSPHSSLCRSSSSPSRRIRTGADPFTWSRSPATDTATSRARPAPTASCTPASNRWSSSNSSRHRRRPCPLPATVRPRHTHSRRRSNRRRIRMARCRCRRP
ncbi:protein enabled-like isoform X2 [Drosophila miranda]|uniref:protein enabled-like isoform X2 n=1 Tax=Drosophila miranda TaxID=7229 RepID=UPI00143F9DC5|nr:protein enabled-like isoform X2 [Drosophila miranda]